MLKTVKIIVVIVLVAGFFSNTSLAESTYSKTRAVEIVTENLTGKDPYLRTKAIEVVSNAGYKPLIPSIEKLLTDDYVPVRFAAAVAVGDIEHSGSARVLRKLVEVGDKSSQIAAAYALAKTGDSSNVHLIRKALKSGDQNLKANAAMLLGKLRDKKSIEELKRILSDLKASDAAMFQAAEALAKLGETAIYPKLWTLLISKHPDDRMFGIQAMSSLGTPEAKQAILTMFYDENLDVRLTAAAELGKFGDKSGQSDVFDALTKPLEQIDVEALERSYNYREKNNDEKNTENSSEPIFKPLNRSPQEYQKDTEQAKTLAALAIGYINVEKLNEFLPGLLSDSSPIVRLGAAQSVLIVNQ